MKKNLLKIPVIYFFLLFCIDLFLAGTDFGSIDPVRWESETGTMLKYLAYRLVNPVCFFVLFFTAFFFMKGADTTYKHTGYYVFSVISFLFSVYYCRCHTSLLIIYDKVADTKVYHLDTNFPFNWWISAVFAVLLPVIYIICAILNHKENKPFGPVEEPASEP